jgi:WD40 repeat protein
VDLWRFEEERMAPLRIINEGFIEIKRVTWAQDSQCYLCYGINPKDTPLSVNIRHIESNTLRQILTQETPVLADFDPFGKYIAVLGVSNVLELYDTRTLDKLRSINLADSKHDVPSLRDKRPADWSPEYSLLAAPNLNDTRVPSTIIFDRNRNFLVRDILLGHPATISCLRFNPNIFEYQSDTTFILAIGDNSGCLSLWRLGKTNNYKEPLVILSSPCKAEESI